MMKNQLKQQYPHFYYFLTTYLEVHLLEGGDDGKPMTIEEIIDLFKKHNNEEIEQALLTDINKIQNEPMDYKLIEDEYIYKIGFETHPKLLLQQLKKSLKPV